MRKASCGLLACTILLAPASAFGWDEQRAPIVGQKYGFGDLEVKTESCIPVKENGLWGFLNEKGKVTIKPVYEEIGEPQEYMAMSSLGDKELKRVAIPVKKNGKWGFVGQNGKEMVKPEYDKVGTLSSAPYIDRIGKKKYETTCIAFQGNSAVLIDTKGKVVKALGGGLTSIIDTPWGLVGFRNGKAQMISGDVANTRVTTYPEYIVVSNSRYSRIYTHNGEILSPVESIHHSVYKVLQAPDGTYILTDSNLKPWNDKRYKNLDRSIEDYLILTTPDNVSEVYASENLNYIGSTDKYVTNVTDKYFFVAADPTKKAFGVTTHDGKEILKPEYSRLSLSGDIFIASKGGKSALLSATGSEILPFEYKSISDCGGNNYLLRGDKGIAVFDAAQNKFVVPFGKYSDIGNRFLKGQAVWVKKGDKWGVATSDLGREIVAPIYDDKEISAGFTTSLDRKNYTIHIKKNGTVGVVNYAGKTIIPVGRYTGVKGYDRGVICVRKGNKVGLVDAETGRQIIAPIHDEIICVGNGHVLAGDNTPTGGVYYIYNWKTGALAKKQAFTRSQAYALSKFMKDWLGYPADFDFTY